MGQKDAGDEEEAQVEECETKAHGGEGAKFRWSIGLGSG